MWKKIPIVFNAVRLFYLYGKAFSSKWELYRTPFRIGTKKAKIKSLRGT